MTDLFMTNIYSPNSAWIPRKKRAERKPLDERRKSIGGSSLWSEGTERKLHLDEYRNSGL